MGSEMCIRDSYYAFGSAGPWSCQAEDWFEDVGLHVQLPMQGVKSTSIVWEAKEQVDATALFCGEDDRFGTHCKFSSADCRQLVTKPHIHIPLVLLLF